MATVAATYGPWAVVTGASSGIGQAFARRLAADGVNLVLAARRLDRLEALGAELGRDFGIEVRPVRADLSRTEGAEAIEKATADIDVAVLVNNAGTVKPGGFLRSDVEDQLDVVRVNVLAPTELAHNFGERFAARGRGAVIFTGSTAAFSGVPLLAGYAATKAYIGSLAEGLHGEWAKLGIDVLVVHPGPTRTEMVEADGVDFGAVPARWMTSEQVASKAVASLGRRVMLVPGGANKVQRLLFTRLLPRRVATRLWGGLMGRVTDDSLQ